MKASFFRLGWYFLQHHTHIKNECECVRLCVFLWAYYISEVMCISVQCTSIRRILKRYPSNLTYWSDVLSVDLDCFHANCNNGHCLILRYIAITVFNRLIYEIGVYEASGRIVSVFQVINPSNVEKIDIVPIHLTVWPSQISENHLKCYLCHSFC